MINVVFVCLGNICRSPMAEGVMAHLVAEAGLSNSISVDSCGTGGWHAGETPHQGTQRILKEKGISYEHRARQLSASDLQDADYLIAMDHSNLQGIRRLGSTNARVALLLDYAKGVNETEVPDPYYTGNFAYVYDLVLAGCEGLLSDIRKDHSL